MQVRIICYPDGPGLFGADDPTPWRVVNANEGGTLGKFGTQSQAWDWCYDNKHEVLPDQWAEQRAREQHNRTRRSNPHV